MDEDICSMLDKAAAATADPSRAMRNMERVFATVEDDSIFIPHLDAVANLFAHSQFLANHCARMPKDLIWALEHLDEPINRNDVLVDAADELSTSETETVAMDRLRIFKRRWLMLITLRDLTGRTDVSQCMEELSMLAEAVTEHALAYATASAIRRHGMPPGGGNELCIIGLGKLGGVEINYSSDIDIIFVYVDREGKTEGVESMTGLLGGRISLHEFYTKVAEGVSTVLGKNTDEGIAYRVDTRLRPGGQKGELVMPLSAYSRYYETLGRTWERIVLIRARPVAGDHDLGRAFLSVVEHFVWHRPADYQEIEEIRALKKKIDSTFTRDDIKRGYGGIREAEFFVQTFQMIYGSDSRLLRSWRMMEAIEGLRRLGMVPEDELNRLADTYLHFRELEHFLQMQDDLQTYRIPSGQHELEVLALKMGFDTPEAFNSDLLVRRMGVKDMYNSLLGTGEDANTEAQALLEGEFSDWELKGYLAFKVSVDTDSALDSLKRLRVLTSQSRPSAERKLVKQCVPGLLDLALKESGAERALKGLEGFLGSYGLKDAYMSALADQEGVLSRGLIRMFAMSGDLTRLILSGPKHLNWLVESMPIRKSLKTQGEELTRLLRRSAESQGSNADRFIKYKSVEWIRLGMLFLLGIIDIHELSRYLSHLADALCGAALSIADPASKGLAIMALGKHGGRELTYGSDLDIVFVSADGVDTTREASAALQMLTAYSGLNSLYEVDTRLRPDGNKGSLVKDMAGYKKYYTSHAHPWEVQALLKARPVAGDPHVRQAFMSLASHVVNERGHELTRELLTDMRQRIVSQLARESEGIDIKLGPGGMEDIEFYVQWLQLSNAQKNPSLLVQNTLVAIDRLIKTGLIDSTDGLTLRSVYEYMKKLSTLLRMNGERVASESSGMAHIAANFMGHKNAAEMMDCLRGHRETVLRLIAG